MMQIAPEPLPNSSDLAERIRTLAAQGLKARDISSLLGIHPQIVLMALTGVAE